MTHVRVHTWVECLPCFSACAVCFDHFQDLSILLQSYSALWETRRAQKM